MSDLGIIGYVYTYIGIMEKKMETTRDYKDNIGIIFGVYRDTGKENGDYSSIIGY